jgi:hypothetical protein
VVVVVVVVVVVGPSKTKFNVGPLGRVVVGVGKSLIGGVFSGR